MAAGGGPKSEAACGGSKSKAAGGGPKSDRGGVMAKPAGGVGVSRPARGCGAGGSLAAADGTAMSPGTRMPGPGSGGGEPGAATGSGPSVRPGSGAGAQGGPPELPSAPAPRPERWPATVLGAEVTAGRKGGSAVGAIAPMPPPCQPPGEGHGSAAGGPGCVACGRLRAPLP